MMVSFPRSGTQSDRVTLKGAKDCVEAAKKRIQEIIEDLVGAGELGAPLGHSGGGRPVRTLRRLPRQAASSRLRQQLTAQCVNARRVGGTSSPRALLPSSEGRERAGGGSSVQRGLVDPLLPVRPRGAVLSPWLPATPAAASEALSLAKPEGSLWSRSRSIPGSLPRDRCGPLPSAWREGAPLQRNQRRYIQIPGGSRHGCARMSLRYSVALGRLPPGPRLALPLVLPLPHRTWARWPSGQRRRPRARSWRERELTTSGA